MLLLRSQFIWVANLLSRPLIGIRETFKICMQFFKCLTLVNLITFAFWNFDQRYISCRQSFYALVLSHFSDYRSWIARRCILSFFSEPIISYITGKLIIPSFMFCFEIDIAMGSAPEVLIYPRYQGSQSNFR